jgi:hypothetical protein
MATHYPNALTEFLNSHHLLVVHLDRLKMPFSATLGFGRSTVVLTKDRWPVLDRDDFLVEWCGKRCPLKDTDMFRLMELLVLGPELTGVSEEVKVDGVGPWVPYIEIEEHCLGGRTVKGSIIRGLKRRLVNKLRDYGLDDLAAAIKSHNEKCRLDFRLVKSLGL